MSGKASASKRKSQQLKRTSKQRANEDGDLPDNEVIKYQIYHVDPLIRNTIYHFKKALKSLVCSLFIIFTLSVEAAV